MLMLMLPTAFALCRDNEPPNVQCRMATPEIVCATYNYSIINESGNAFENGTLTPLQGNIYYFNFTQPIGDYVIRICDGSTREITVGVDTEMSSIAITLFILIISIALYITPFIKKTFVKSEMGNLIIKRGFFIIATYLMTLNSAIMATIANLAGIPITEEMFMYMFLFGWAGYGLMVFLVVKTLLDIVEGYKQKQKEIRIGET